MINNITDIDGVVDDLFSAEILTRHLKERINEKKGTEKLRELLDILPKRGNKAFYAFYDALVQCQEYEAANLLCPEKAGELRKRLGQEGEDVTTGDPSGGPQEEIPADWILDPLRIEVTPVSDDSMKKKFNSADSLSGQIYPVRNGTKGCCLLINNFGLDCGQSSCTVREKADAWKTDLMTMDLLFKKLGFKVERQQNQRLNEAVDKQMMRLMDKELDCYVCLLLAHGSGTNLHCSNGSLKSMLTQVAHCSMLADKPKLFIVQTCARVDSSDEKLLKEMEKMTLNDEGDSSVDKLTDLLILRSNLPDLLQPEDCGKGTLFMQSLAFAISSYSHKYDFRNIVPLINKLAAVKAGKDRVNDSVCDSHCLLEKEFYLFPGL